MNLHFTSFNRKQDIEYFLRGVGHTKDNKINIDMEQDFFSTPEVMAPIAGIIDLLKDHDYHVRFNFNKNVLMTSGLERPFTVQKNEYELLSPMYKIWKYNSSEEVSKIVSAYVNTLNQRIVCAKGVIEAFEWTVNEVMDNVIQHSESQYGYIVCTVTANKHISVAIYDNGIGIWKSFQNSQYRFKNAHDAIVRAMEAGITRDKTIGQGNGLWGMAQMLSNNRGLLNITSSDAIISINEKNVMTKDTMGAGLTIYNYGKLPGTLVDFQFNCSNEIQFSKIFGKDYQYANLYLESLEDDNDRLVIKVKSFSFGYATRSAGEKARNIAINLVAQSNAKQLVLIDFDGISIMSSSFADEFIGKLICYYGFIQFNNLFRIINVKEENIAIINRSVMQRISEEQSSNN